MLKVSQNVNQIFTPLWETKARYIICVGGRGAGRSTASSQYVLSRLLAKDYFRCAIMREIHSDIRHTIWKEVMDRVDEQNLRNAEGLKITDNEMGIVYGANSIRAHGFRQASKEHTAKLKSLANYNTVIIEEAREVGEREFMILDDSLRTLKGDIRIVLDLNPPPKNHWIIKRWFDLTEHDEAKGFFNLHLKKEIDDTVYIPGNFWENIVNLDAHTIKRYKEYKKTDPDYYWQEIHGLVPEVVRGKIYHGWQQIDKIPKEARLVGLGLDFGWYPDPLAVAAIWYWNGSYVIDEVAYGNHLSNEIAARKIKEYGSALTIADSAEPKSIEEMRGFGVKIIGAEKGKGSVEYTIKLVSGKKIYVTEKSKNIWSDYETYAWAETKDGEAKGIPAHPGSHGMAAIGYGMVGLGKKTGIAPKVFRPSWSSYGRVGVRARA